MGWEIIAIIAFIIGFLALSAGVKRLCRKYMKGRKNHDDQ